MSTPITLNYRRARGAIQASLGPLAIAEFHRPIPLLDWAVVTALPLIFAANALALATMEGWAWVSVLLLQGFIIQMFGYVVHDLFVHRRVGGRGGYYLGAVYELPIAVRRTWYAHYHLDHHAAMNADDDPEAYKQDLDTRMKRLMFLTLPGAFMAMARRLKPRNAFSPHVRMAPRRMPDEAGVRRRLQFEGVLAGCWIAVIVLASVAWWELAILGYVLPLTLVTPIASSLRTILEHAECDPGNVFHCATFYRTGAITGPLFFWDAGDCHIVHHIYPAIPFYRMPAAVKAIAPVLRAHGAVECHSLLRLLRGWFWRNEAHRTVWAP
jgi:fatty acid desaturase